MATKPVEKSGKKSPKTARKPATRKAATKAPLAKTAAKTKKAAPKSKPASKTAPKPKATKAAPAKAPAKEARPAKKPESKAPARKAAAKTAAPAKKAAPVKKPAKASSPARPAAKVAAAIPPASAKGAKRPADKPAASPPKAGAKAPAKAQPAPPARKPLVGQKPRSPKTAASVATAIQPPRPAAAAGPIKATPASLEAKQDFKVNDHVVYPAHGVGRIVGIEKQVIAGITNELFLIDFEQEKMKLRVPTAKAKAVGMRPLSDPALVKKAVDTLKGRARIKRTMWSRRAQEYEAKINSGDIISVAEVVRDLYRASDQPEQSYSERQLFEAALDRLAREVAAVNRIDLAKALAELEAALQQKKAA
jgi:CarD family transcriptional regulator